MVMFNDFELCHKNSYFVNMISPKVSIIIVNYNVKYFLENCLLSVLKSIKNISAEIIVADNDSTDGSDRYFNNQFPKVEFLFLPENIGFAKANNAALQKAKGKYILFLNPDTIIAENTIENCVEYMDQHDEAGAIGVQMTDGSGNFLKESKRGLPNVKNAFGKFSGFSKLLPGIFGGYYADHIPKDTVAAVDVLAGAFFFTRKNILDTIGSFDEQFFMFGEDVDLSYRMQQAGFKNIYLGTSSIIHFKGESTQKKSAAYHRNFFGAMHLFVNKHQQKNKFWLHAAIHINAFISKSKQLFKYSATPDAENKKTAIMCSQAVFTDVIKILQQAIHPVVIIGRLSLEKNDKDHCFGYIDQLPVFLKNNLVEQIVLCGSYLSNLEAIELVKQYASKVSFLFYQEGSKSIVGSDDKNSNGIFIAAR